MQSAGDLCARLVGRHILSFRNERYTLSSVSIAQHESVFVCATYLLSHRARLYRQPQTACLYMLESRCHVIPSHQNSPNVCKGASSLKSINAEQNIVSAASGPSAGRLTYDDYDFWVP